VRNRFKFNKVFGLTLSDRFDETYYSILLFTILFFALAILINSSIDYSRYQVKAEKLFRYKYKAFITELLVDEIKRVNPEIKDVSEIVVAPTVEINRKPVSRATLSKNLKIQREKIAKKIRKNTIFQTNAKSNENVLVNTNSLPEINDYFEEMPENVEAEEITRTFRNPPLFKSKASVTNFDPGDIDGPPDNLFNYIVRRQGTAYLDVTKQLVKEPISRLGYRDPEEVEQVVQRYSPMIEYCFRKHTKFTPNARGFIKVAFKVSYEGYVIPESVRIVNSNIRNRALEQCIKNYIKHWRDFKPLDESMGIAQVIQKFVFN